MPSTKPAIPIRDALRETTARLERVSDSARLDAEILVARAIDMPRSYLFAHPEDALDGLAAERLEETITRRLAGTPIAYITGKKEFWSLALTVSEATLVPRPETELVVELALREIPRRADWNVLDLGTGSGAIAIAIASERPNCEVTAVDASKEALAIASQNARRHELANVQFIEGNWTEPVIGREFRVIVSNPPYVAKNDPALAQLGAEPSAALVSGDDGLEAIRCLARECRALISDDGLMVLEHGNEQREAVAAILAARGWRDIDCTDDYAGRPRVTSARPKARNNDNDQNEPR